MAALVAVWPGITFAGMCDGDFKSGAAFEATTRHGYTLWRPPAVCDGQVLVVEIEGACDDPWLLWQGGSFGAFAVDDRLHALLPVRLGTETGEYRLGLTCGGRRASFPIPVRSAVYPSSELRVDPKFSRQPPSRAASESSAIGDALRRSASERLWSESFVLPAGGKKTSPFGVRRLFNGDVKDRHFGLDIDDKWGRPLRAANAGVVNLVANDFYYVGNAVIIDHGFGLVTLYGHMSRVDVAQGQRVQKGQIIGAIGKTGRATGPHVHFAAKLNGRYIDPEMLLLYEPRRYGGVRSF